MEVVFVVAFILLVVRKAMWGILLHQQLRVLSGGSLSSLGGFILPLHILFHFPSLCTFPPSAGHPRIGLRLLRTYLGFSLLEKEPVSGSMLHLGV